MGRLVGIVDLIASVKMGKHATRLMERAIMDVATTSWGGTANFTTVSIYITKYTGCLVKFLQINKHNE